MKFRSCTEQHQFLNSCLELMSMNPFLDTLTLLYFLRDTSDEPEKEIYGEKYFIRFETFAMNEMLGRPTPKVLDMNGFLLDSLKGNSDNLDRVLGFADSTTLTSPNLCCPCSLYSAILVITMTIEK